MSLKDDEILEQIALLIASFPSYYLLQPDLMTDDQINEWDESRKIQTLLAECWRCKFITKQGDSIAEARDRKEISKHKYDLINLTVNRYKAQWELIEQGEKYVRQAHSKLQNISTSANLLPYPFSQIWHKFFQKAFLKKYPFQSAYDLFAITLKEEIDGRFYWCRQDNYDITIKKWRAATKQFSQILEKETHDGIYPKLNPIETEKLKSNLGWHKLAFSWLGMTLLVCQFAALNDPSLKNKLIEFNKSLYESLKLATTASRELRGFKWKKGKVVYASKKGGVYPEN